jgi:hypothetical protein
MKYIIQTISEPLLFVKEVIPSDDGYLPTLTNDVELAMKFRTLDEANSLIQQLVEPSNFIGHRPPHRPK